MSVIIGWPHNVPDPRCSHTVPMCGNFSLRHFNHYSSCIIMKLLIVCGGQSSQGDSFTWRLPQKKIPTMLFPDAEWSRNVNGRALSPREIITLRRFAVASPGKNILQCCPSKHDLHHVNLPSSASDET